MLMVGFGGVGVVSGHRGMNAMQVYLFGVVKYYYFYFFLLIQLV
jgi:hypothetical protein